MDLDFLGSSRFRRENPRLSLLDFLGFPWILSCETRLINGLHRINGGIFPASFSLDGGNLRVGDSRTWGRNCRLVHEASLTNFLIFCKKLSSRPRNSPGEILLKSLAFRFTPAPRLHRHFPVPIPCGPSEDQLVIVTVTTPAAPEPVDLGDDASIAGARAIIRSFTIQIGPAGAAGPVPESSTRAMRLIGFGGLGYAAVRRGRAVLVSLRVTAFYIP
jgi:hypothetical protein